jgi:hypothetical protein
MANRRSSAALRRPKATGGTLAYHPTKGHRRVSDLRVMAQAKLPFMRLKWAQLGAAAL